MKLKLNIVILTEDDYEGEIDYDSLPMIGHIFYDISAIYPINDRYTAIYSMGMEFVANVKFSKLEKDIDRQKHIIISDN